MELSSHGIKLEISETKETPQWKDLYGLKSVPDIGAEPEQIEVTNLADNNKRYIDGIKDFGTLEFGFFLNSEEQRDAASATKIKESYTFLRAFEKNKQQPWLRLCYPNGMGFMWQGNISTKIAGAEVNAALEFTLNTSLLSDMEDVTIS